MQDFGELGCITTARSVMHGQQNRAYCLLKLADIAGPVVIGSHLLLKSQQDCIQQFRYLLAGNSLDGMGKQRFKARAVLKELLAKCGKMTPRLTNMYPPELELRITL